MRWRRHAPSTIARLHLCMSRDCASIAVAEQVAGRLGVPVSVAAAAAATTTTTTTAATKQVHVRGRGMGMGMGMGSTLALATEAIRVDGRYAFCERDGIR